MSPEDELGSGGSVIMDEEKRSANQDVEGRTRERPSVRAVLPLRDLRGSLIEYVVVGKR